MADPSEQENTLEAEGGQPRPPDGSEPGVWVEPTVRADLISWGLAILWGGAPVAVKLSLENNHPLRVATLRLAVGAVMLLIAEFTGHASLRPRRDDWIPLLLAGLLFAGHTAAVHYGTHHTSAAHSAVIFGINPAISMALAHFLVPGDRMDRRAVLGSIVVYGGLIVVFVRHMTGEGAEPLGDLVMLVAAATLAVRQISVTLLSQRLNPIKIVFYEVAIALPIMLAATFAFETSSWEWHWELAIAAVYNGVLMSGTGLLINTRLLQRYRPSRILSQQMVIPVFGVLFGWLILGDEVGWELAIGAAVIVIGFAISPRRPFPVSDKPAAPA